MRPVVAKSILFAGILLALGSIIIHQAQKFNPNITWFWMAGILIIGCSFFFKQPKTAKVKKSFDRKDLFILSCLLTVFLPLYIFKSFEIPLQMNSDEIVITKTISDSVQQEKLDILGPSNYFDFPNMVFWLMGQLILLSGQEIDIKTVRQAHAIIGACIVAASYMLGRLLLSRREGVALAVILGSSHSLFFTSRMAMRDNSALFIEILALTFLLYGWLNVHRGWTFIGGASAGIGWYVYYPARAVIIIWLVSLAVYFCINKFKNSKKVISLSIVALLGFCLVSAPIILTQIKAGNNEYSKSQILVYQSGRELQRYWVNAASEKQAFLINLKQGLTSLNSSIYDNGNIYDHYGHGFIDKFSGLFTWLGLFGALIFLVRNKTKRLEIVLPITGFTLIYLSLSFLFTKAPNYTRMLILLPFIAFFIVYSSRTVYQFLLNLGRIKKLEHITQSKILIVIVSIVVLANTIIIYDYIRDGKLYGDPLADIKRYQIKNSEPSLSWMLVVAGKPVFEWGTERDWKYFLSFGQSIEQTSKVATQDQGFNLEKFLRSVPGQKVLITSRQYWQQQERDIKTKFYVVAEESLHHNSDVVAITIL